MSRMLKVVAAADHGALAAQHNVIKKYDAFVVVDVSDSVAKQLELLGRGHHRPIQDTARW
jgi:hypothetical protein